jgi:DNA-binding MarR family transcriptional regulator
MDEEFRHSLGFLTHDVARLLGRRFEEKAKGIGASRAQSRVMAYLTLHPGINQIGLAELLEIQPISLARLLDRMEAAQLVERRPDAADRRVKRLHLTGKAHRLLDRVWAVAMENNAEALAGLKPEECKTLLDLLGHVHDNLTRLHKAPASAA